MESSASVSLRERILEEALTIVRREGAAGITMRAIARKLGYSPATLYLYVASKDALLQEVALHGFQLLGEAVAPAAGVEDPEQAVVEVSRGFLEFALRDPHLYRLMFEKLDLTRYRDDPSPGVPGRVLFDAMAALLQRG